jgi:flagellar hook-length control protein FliK
LEVRLSLQQDQANVTFFSHDSAVRHAIESSLPRLREMLDGQGVRLAQAQVSDQSLARQQQDSGGQTSGRHRGYGPVDDGITIGSETDSPRVTRTALGMVDHYV